MKEAAQRLGAIRGTRGSVFGGAMKGIDFLITVAALIVVMLVPVKVLGQQSFASEYIRSEFNVEQGLPDNVVNAIAQTGNGLLWVGTDTGLATFDGRDFHHVELRIPREGSLGAVNTLLKTTNGDLWVGTDAGLVVIPREALGHADPVPLQYFPIDPGQPEGVQALFETRAGVMWVATNLGLYRRSHQALVPVLKDTYVNRIGETADHRLLVVAKDELLELDGDNTVPPLATDAQLSLKKNWVFDAHQDRNGTLWYGTRRGIRRQLIDHTADPLAETFWTSTDAKASCNHIYEDSEGTMWFASGQGVFRVQHNQAELVDPTELARAIYVSADGDLWLGTNGAGLVHYKRRPIQMYTRKDGLPNDQPMSVLIAPDGRLLVGSNCGFSVFDGSRFRNYGEKDGLLNTCVWSLAKDPKQNVWIGTYGGGLFKFRNGHFKQYTKANGLADTVVTEIVVARDGSLWIATLDGVSHMTGEHIQNYGRGDGLSSTKVLSIREAGDHSIWVATQAGIERLVGDKFQQLAASSGEVNAAFSQLLTDGTGDLYVAGAIAGLARLNGQQTSVLLHDLDVNGIVETSDQQLWCAGRHGLYRISKRSLQERVTVWDSPLDYAWFNNSDGLLSSQASVGTPNIVGSVDGRLWMATVKGLAVLNTREWPRAGRRPDIFLTDALVDGTRASAGDELAVPPGSHRIELHIGAVDLDTPDNIRLQYRLEGIDAVWQDGGTSRAAIYTSLPPGTHRLLVRSTDSNGVWGGTVFTYAVSQEAFFYQKVWFRTCMLTILCFLLAFLYLLRVKSLVGRAHLVLEERMRERERIARDLHDTFFQAIQGLLLRFNTGTNQLKQDEPARALLEETLKQSDRVMLEGRELVLEIRGGEAQERGDLSSAIAEVASTLRKTRETDFRMIRHGSPHAFHPIVGEEAYRIGREALTNAFLHAKAHMIEAELTYAEGEFRMRIRDDGVGLDPTVVKAGSRPGHWGLPGMRERARLIGGQLAIWSRVGTGTEVELKVPAAIAYAERRLSLLGRLQGAMDRRVGKKAGD